jgi:hypothetical protein
VFATGTGVGTIGGLLALVLGYTGLAFIFWGALLAFLLTFILFAYGPLAGATAWTCVGALFIIATGIYVLNHSMRHTELNVIQC